MENESENEGRGRYLLEKVGGDEALVALVQGVEDALQLLIFLQMDVQSECNG